MLRKNRVFNGRAAGIEVTNGGGGVITENEVFDNHFDGICLATGVSPSLEGALHACACACTCAYNVSLHVYHACVFTKSPSVV